MIDRTEEEQAGLDLQQATTAVLREVRRFYELGGMAGTSSPLAKSWEFYLAAASVAGVELQEYQRRPAVAPALAAAAPALAEALEGFLADETDSYCEYCGSHAPKDGDGHLLAFVVHATGCPVPPAHAALVKAGLEEAADGHL